MSTIWCEKYRPSTLDDLILAPATKKVLKTIINSTDVSASLTNQLYSGSAGTGKTSSAKLIPKLLDLPCHYIKASEENGVDVLRTRVKDFSTSQTIDNKIKVVILDEADGITAAGQAALRNIIESTHKSTRFILTCNYPEKIIAPLHSRLKEIVFSAVDEKTVLRRLTEILRAEKIVTPQEQVPNLIALVKKFFPDIRKIINHLQHFSATGTLEIEFTDIVSADIFEQIITAIQNKKLSDLRQILRNNKLDYEGMVRKVFDEVLKDDSAYFKLNEAKRAEIILLCADTLFKGNFVTDKEINFLAFAVELANIG